MVYFSFSIPEINQLSNIFGKLALITYVLTLVPGMAKRFGINFLPISVLLLYRRQIGIMMFVLALVHMITSGMFLSSEPFIVVSTMAMVILFLLFVTSNNLSVKILAKYWHILQRLTYVAMILIIFHLTLIRFSTTALILIGVAIMGLISHVYKRYTTKCPTQSPL